MFSNIEYSTHSVLLYSVQYVMVYCTTLFHYVYIKVHCSLLLQYSTNICSGTGPVYYIFCTQTTYCFHVFCTVYSIQYIHSELLFYTVHKQYICILTLEYTKCIHSNNDIILRTYPKPVY